MFELVEPIGVIPYSADEPNDAMFALGFSNFAPGEVARHVPSVWNTQDRVEALTDELAAAPYVVLARAELDELIAALEPLAAALVAAQD